MTTLLYRDLGTLCSAKPTSAGALHRVTGRGQTGSCHILRVTAMCDNRGVFNETDMKRFKAPSFFFLSNDFNKQISLVILNKIHVQLFDVNIFMNFRV